MISTLIEITAPDLIVFEFDSGQDSELSLIGIRIRLLKDPDPAVSVIRIHI